jgi:hypothetical protein
MPANARATRKKFDGAPLRFKGNLRAAGQMAREAHSDTLHTDRHTRPQGRLRWQCGALAAATPSFAWVNG